MSRKDPYFSFKDKDSAEYKPQYGTAYTPRQEKKSCQANCPWKTSAPTN